jgi:hypothetical protein
MKGRLAQLVERLVYTEDVGGSSPSSPIEKLLISVDQRQRFTLDGGYSYKIRLVCSCTFSDRGSLWVWKGLASINELHRIVLSLERLWIA